MTPAHMIFIPTVFLLGVLAGLLLTSRRTGGLPVLLTLGLALGTFGITHLTELPIGAGAVAAATGGAPLFDQSPSFQASDVLARIELFGSRGREAYLLETYTGDVLFPLTLLAFLLTLGRFAASQMQPAAWRHLFRTIPLAWFAIDMLENGMIHALLRGYPAPSQLLAALLGPVTTAKFVLLAVSIFGPLLVLGRTILRQRTSSNTKPSPDAQLPAKT